MMSMEKWFDIPGLDYQISEDCNKIRSFRKKSNLFGETLKGQHDKNNYTWFYLPIDGEENRVRFGLHHLSYRTFIDRNFLPNRKLIIDHIDNNQLNNKPNNLQAITQYINCIKDKYGKKSSKYVGVCKIRQTGKWTAQIKHNGRKIHLGTFDNEDEAYESYRKKAYELKKIVL